MGSRFCVEANTSPSPHLTFNRSLTATNYYDWSVPVLSCLFSIFTAPLPPGLCPPLCCTDRSLHKNFLLLIVC